jgi:hypothetical protein
MRGTQAKFIFLAAVAALAIPFLFLEPVVADDDECLVGCNDTEPGSWSCGPCMRQLVDYCTSGCICSTCDPEGGEGECHCSINNEYYQYFSATLYVEDGSCEGGACGERRFRASSLANQLGRDQSLHTVSASRAKKSEDVPNWWSTLLYEERIYVPSRCTHAYRMLIKSPPAKQEVGGM